MRVKHPSVPGFVKSVEVDRLDEWLAAGWLPDGAAPEPVEAPTEDDKPSTTVVLSDDNGTSRKRQPRKG